MLFTEIQVHIIASAMYKLLSELPKEKEVLISSGGYFATKVHINEVRLTYEIVKNYRKVLKEIRDRGFKVDY